MSVKSMQQQLGVQADGVWGPMTQSAFITSGKSIAFDWTALRKYFGSFTQSQVDGLNAVLTAINAHTPAKNPAYAAYILATAWHETAHKMQPIEEYGRGRGRRYGGYYDIDGSRYQNLPHLYYGRGHVQLTWLTNYKRFSTLLGVDLVNHPERALEPAISSKILVLGMVDGLFTGKRLSDYIRFGVYKEFVNARRIVNGTDKDTLIAGYAVKFLDSLTLAA